MKKLLFLVGLAVFCTATGLAEAQNTGLTFDRNTDFSKYKTYKWVTIPNAEHLDELTNDQLIGTLNVELAKKGLKKSDSDKADLYIGYQIAPGKNKPLNQYNVGGSYGPAGGGAARAGATSTVVHSGQLVLDMYDSATKQLVWRNVVAHAIDPDAKPDKKQSHMDKAVEKLLKDYPPQRPQKK